MDDRCGLNLKFFGGMLLAGCCLGSAAAETWQIPQDQEIANSAEPRMARLIHSADLPEQEAAQPTPLPVSSSDSDENKYWAFPSENETGPELNFPAIVPLPSVSTTDSQTSVVENESSDSVDEQIALLLPPQIIAAVQPTNEEPSVELESLEPENIEVNEEDVVSELTTEEQKIVDAVILDSRAATTGVLTDRRVNQIAQTKIRNAYAMAGRGAFYSARQELIEVLRMISHSKDAAHGKAKQTLDLAAGLRALEEAEDFAPRGTQLEADLVIDVICASHRTPVGRQLKSKGLLPRQMMNCYFRYAQLKLAASVKDEPAGSMALHALGKITSRLNQVEPEKHRLGHRRAVAFQQASLLAHHKNHLAAHELAVLLADSGHYTEAEQLLEQVATREPNAIVYRNLANVQEKLGRAQQAAASRDYAQQLIRQGAGGMSNVQWVSPQDFARSSGNSMRFASTTSHPPASRPHAAQTITPTPYFPAPASNWR